MAGETLRRRRPSATTSARDAEPTSDRATRSEDVSTGAGAAEGVASDGPKEPKTLVELVDEEEKSHSQFLSLVGLIMLLFLYMIRSTELPAAGRVTAVVVDAGTTGTRAQVFHFAHDAASGRLRLNATTMQQSAHVLASLAAPAPPLSPAKFFRGALDFAKKSVVGQRRRRRTPLIMRATAGLRALGDEGASRALEKARGALNASEFLVDDDGVGVLEPGDEARFGWTSVNFLLGNFADDAPPSRLVGTLEMGGGSLQIVYDVGADEGAEVPAAERHTASVFGTAHALRARSYDGLGLVDSMRRLYGTFEEEGVLAEGNPCFRLGKTFKDKVLQVGLRGRGKKQRVTIVGDGDFERCVMSAEIAIGALGPTSLPVDKAGRVAAALPKDSTFYAFAFFYDRVVGLGLSSEPTREQLVAKGQQLCETKPGTVVDGDFDEACAEFSYVFAVLKILTEDFSKERGVKVKFEQYVDGHMLGWALAAALEAVTPTVASQVALDTDPVTLP